MQGYQVLGFDFPQHGERVYETDFIMQDQCVREPESMYEYAKGHAQAVSLFGCSMGAYIFQVMAQRETLNRCGGCYGEILI